MRVYAQDDEPLFVCVDGQVHRSLLSLKKTVLSLCTHQPGDGGRYCDETWWGRLLSGSSVFKSLSQTAVRTSSRSVVSLLKTASETRRLRHRIASLCVLPSAIFLR